MNRPKFHVKKGDNVQVITGNHRGAKGKILAVLPKKSQVIIEETRPLSKRKHWNVKEVVEKAG